MTDRLLPHHEKILIEKSAINRDVITRRGYFSITTSKEAEELGFSLKQAVTVSEKYPALIIPYYGPDGSNGVCCMRPDNPRSVDDKKKKRLPDGTYPQRVFRYEMPQGAGNVLDCHPDVIPYLNDPARLLIFTEGAKKADSLLSKGFLAINLNGVWGWRGTNAKRGKTVLSDFDLIALNGRKSVLLFDSDVVTNDNVKAALRRFKSFLETKGAIVTPVLIPGNVNGSKIGIDDWFAADHTADELNQLIAYFDVFSLEIGSKAKKWTTEAFRDLFREWGCHFAINDMNESTEVNGALLDDTRMDIIEAQLMDDSIPVNHARKAITVYANSYRYHPIKDYLENLKWDGADWIHALAGYFTDQDRVFEIFLKRWLIGAVAKVMDNQQNFMLVLGGPQDIGKSYFAHWICPLDKYFLESPLNPDDKDTLVRLISNFIWEVGELGSVTRRADREALKRIITMQTVTVRKSYGKFDTLKPAIASFIGTVNPDAGFLNDPTGNRRYATCILKGIDFNYAQDIDKDQIWAQAVALFKAGEPWRFTINEAKDRDRINAEHEQPEPLEDMIFDKFEIDSSKATVETWRLTGPQILEYLGLKPEDRALQMRLSSVLRKAGLERTNPMTDGKRYYLGIRAK